MSITSTTKDERIKIRLAFSNKRALVNAIRSLSPEREQEQEQQRHYQRLIAECKAEIKHCNSGGPAYVDKARLLTERLAGLEQYLQEIGERIKAIDRQSEDLQKLLRPASSVAEALLKTLGPEESAFRDELATTPARFQLQHNPTPSSTFTAGDAA